MPNLWDTRVATNFGEQPNSDGLWYQPPPKYWLMMRYAVVQISSDFLYEHNYSYQHFNINGHLDMHLNFVPIHAYYSKKYKVMYLVVEFFLDSTVVQMITKYCQVLKSIHVPTSIHWCMISRAARNVKFGNTLFYLLLEFFMVSEEHMKYYLTCSSKVRYQTASQHKFCIMLVFKLICYLLYHILRNRLSINHTKGMWVNLCVSILFFLSKYGLYSLVHMIRTPF